MANCRCLKTKGILLVDCCVDSHNVKCGILFTQGPEVAGQFSLLDPDTGNRISVVVPPLDESPVYNVDLMRL